MLWNIVLAGSSTLHASVAASQELLSGIYAGRNHKTRFGGLTWGITIPALLADTAYKCIDRTIIIQIVDLASRVWPPPAGCVGYYTSTKWPRSSLLLGIVADPDSRYRQKSRRISSQKSSKRLLELHAVLSQLQVPGRP
jgi:hypothetical protein